MIELEETERGVRAVDTAKNEVEIELEGWVPGGEGLDVGRRTQAMLSGYVTRVELPGRIAFIESRERTRHRIVKYNETRSVAADEHLVQTDTIVTVYLRTNDAFAIGCDIARGAVEVTFEGAAYVTIGLRSHADYPSRTVRVPPTPEGLSAALTAFGTSHHTDSPDRSYPSMRGHPPEIEVEPRSDPANDSGHDSESSVTLTLPSTFEHVFFSASLAYYLGARVTVSDVDRPVVHFGDEQYAFPRTIAAFSREASSLLSRVFYLDSLTRNAGPYGFDLAELELLDEISIDADDIYPLPVAERMKEYVRIDFERIAERLPQWPLSVSIDPEEENVPALSRLSYCLSLLFPPESDPVDDQTTIKRSLGDFYRSASSDNQQRAVEYSNIVDPVNRVGTLHGWIADGIPLDSFKGLPCAFTDRTNPPTDPSPRSVAVVLNDGEMDAEFTEVITAYRERRAVCSIDVDLSTCLTTSELASIFQSPYDIIHYIGHCDPQGLRCEDGYFSVASLPDTMADTVFLNACGSYDEGLAFVRKGGTSCGVTIGDVLDDQASKVGTTFARLLGRGFGFAFALVLARCRSIMNRRYAIVGDGTNVLSQGESNYPTALYISEVPPGAYRVRPYQCLPTYHGSILYDFPNATPVLAGNDSPQMVSEDELQQKLLSTDHPIIYEDAFYWPDEFIDNLN